MITDKKIIGYRQLAALRQKASKANKKIVFTAGCYDLLHLGHLMHLHHCKSLGDILVVQLGTDKNLRLLKGSGRPIFNQTARARMLAALTCVDYVVISRESGKIDHRQLLQLLRPDIYVVPETDSVLTQKKRVAEAYGARFVTCRRYPPKGLRGVSTTAIFRRLGL